ncbi:glycosyltransferase family 1 protein [Aulographum hederae CBS 113979]|uniref:UDP-N-acetylglucosamine transferase subunit ALG14 n=1 Tax=Aulographum hederae CBS 113979 TaxID=1176131 RepID=A0A6G1H0X3_9PEZI|nr:glycosyltransferase family 1 protein [Aulographum hederae CBS 113979]
MIPTPYFLQACLTLFVITIIAATARAISILPPRPVRRKRARGTPTSMMMVLGSGGHTAEMLAIQRDLDPSKYTHRFWVIGEEDWMSRAKAVEFEEGLVEKVMKSQRERKEEEVSASKELGDGEAKFWYVGPDSYDIFLVPRARKIHQPLYTTPWTALLCLWACLKFLCHCKAAPCPKTTSGFTGPLPVYAFPDVILVNGPATATILVYATLILRFFNFRSAESQGGMRTIYIESWARVKTLSLSGKLLLRVVDRFVVQWPDLEGIGGRGEYHGVVVG